MKKQIVVVLGLFLVLSMACSCTFLNLNRIPDIVIEAGSGKVVTKDYEIEPVSQVEIESIGTLHLIQGDTPSLTIEAEDNYIDKFDVKVTGDKLVIKVENKWYDSWLPTETIHYYLTLPNLTDLKLAGAIRLESEELNLKNMTIECAGANDVQLGTLNADSLTFDLSGAANMKVSTINADSLSVKIAGVSSVDVDTLDANSLDLHISGSGNMNVAGEVVEQTINIDGGGAYQAGDLRSSSASVSSSGAASITLWTTENLSLNCDGVVSVSYYGSPALEQENDGMVVINSLGDK